MPSFSRPLEESLHRAVAYANQRKHEYATLEHLLLSLTDDEDAAGVMRACDVDLTALKKSLSNYLDVELASLVVDDDEDAKPTAGFQRVIQRAIIDEGCEIPDGTKIGVDPAADRKRFEVTAKGVVLVTPEMLRDLG